MKRFSSRKGFILGIMFCMFSSSIAFTEESRKPTKDSVVSSGKKVSIEYSLKLKDKSVVDTNVGSKPLTFIQGSRELLPALENALKGMKIGESKQITITPEEGYGPVDKNAVIELEIGTVLQSLNSDGQPIYAQVSEIREKTILLDFNHPLAGKTLYFDIKILDIQEVPTS